MKRNIILLVALAAVCGGASAQQKQSGARLDARNSIVCKRTVIDTADLRIKYAWGAIDIGDPSTYLDLGQLQIGKRCTKYCSFFVEQANDQRVAWDKEHPHANAVPNGERWMQGRVPGTWSEYQFSDIFFYGDTLNEWASMPQGQVWPQRYTEKMTPIAWTLGTDTTTILGHPCQLAICHWRGRDYEAWFATDIPIRRGPWKFGGLPGLIMKIYDKDRLYVFEAVAIERGSFPIYQYPKDEFQKSTRKRTYELQVAFNRNYMKTAGIREYDPTTNTIGDVKSSPHDYDPMELE
jgi:GLPGLI family protein